MEGEREPEGTDTLRGEPLVVDTRADGGVSNGGAIDGGLSDGGVSDTCPPAIHITEGDPDQLEEDTGSVRGGVPVVVVVVVGDTDKELDARSLGDAETTASSPSPPPPPQASPPAPGDPQEDDGVNGSIPLLSSDGPQETHTHLLLTQPAPLSPPSARIQNQSSEPCWYCLRSLEPEHQPQDSQKQLDTEALKQGCNSVVAVPPGGQKVNYQTDPRPHFGVACSSRSTALPLWGSEGPSWVARNPGLVDQMDTCPHCHIGLPPDTLRWHETKCVLFDGFKS